MKLVELTYQKDTNCDLEHAFLVLHTDTLSEQFAAEFEEQINYLDDNPPSGCLIISSRASNFWCSWTLSDIKNKNNFLKLLPVCSKLEKLLSLILHLPCPTVAKITSLCQGWGISLALSCDWRWVSAEAKFNSAEVLNGLPAGFSSWMLPKLVGYTSAKKFLLGQETWNAAQACQLGLADLMLHGDSSSTEAEKLRQLGSAPRLAWLSTRRLLSESSASLRENHLGAYLASLSQVVNTEV
ncbi:MAG: enoyl-CoA hydratase/isomerase family protein [Candidatus Bruticola sp.]